MFMNIGSELPTQLHKATLAEVDQKIHQSVHLPLTIYLALKFYFKARNEANLLL